MDNVLLVVESRDPRTRDSRPEFLWATGCAAVRRAVRSNVVRFIATRASLPDGNWYTLLRELVESSSPARLVVCSPEPNESLRLTALSLGAGFAVGDPAGAQPA